MINDSSNLILGGCNDDNVMIINLPPDSPLMIAINLQSDDYDDNDYHRPPDFPFVIIIIMIIIQFFLF